MTLLSSSKADFEKVDNWHVMKVNDALNQAIQVGHDMLDQLKFYTIALVLKYFANVSKLPDLFPDLPAQTQAVIAQSFDNVLNRFVVFSDDGKPVFDWFGETKHAMRTHRLGQSKRRKWTIAIPSRSPRYARHRGPKADFNYQRIPHK